MMAVVGARILSLGRLVDIVSFAHVAEFRAGVLVVDAEGGDCGQLIGPQPVPDHRVLVRGANGGELRIGGIERQNMRESGPLGSHPVCVQNSVGPPDPGRSKHPPFVKLNEGSFPRIGIPNNGDATPPVCICSYHSLKVSCHASIFVLKIADGERKVAYDGGRLVLGRIRFFKECHMGLERLIVAHAVLNSMVINEGLIESVGNWVTLALMVGHMVPDFLKECSHR